MAAEDVAMQAARILIKFSWNILPSALDGFTMDLRQAAAMWECVKQKCMQVLAKRGKELVIHEYKWCKDVIKEARFHNN